MSELKTTACTGCSKQIKYTTRKPKLCTVCRQQAKAAKPADAKPAGAKAPVKRASTKRRRPDSKNTQGELVMFRALDRLMGNTSYINHGYYSNLPSPKGHPMQLDRYYPELKLAFEFDGRQHAQFEKYIHGTVKNFNYYKECDHLKEQHCTEQGITLIRIAWNYKITSEALKLDILKANKDLHDRLF